MEDLGDIVKKESHRMFFSEDGKFSAKRIGKYIAHSQVGGCLPAKDQKKYCGINGLDAVVLTKYNSATNLSWGVAAYTGIVDLAIPFLTTIVPSAAALHWPAMLYATAFVIDGAVRYAYASGKKEPCTSPILLPQLIANYSAKKSGTQEKIFNLIGGKKGNGKEAQQPSQEKIKEMPESDTSSPKRPNSYRFFGHDWLESIKNTAHDKTEKFRDYWHGE